jgi:hypothetical protein
MITEKDKTNARTTTDIHALLIVVKRKRITGVKRIETAKNTATRRATALMRD